MNLTLKIWLHVGDIISSSFEDRIKEKSLPGAIFYFRLNSDLFPFHQIECVTMKYFCHIILFMNMFVIIQNEKPASLCALVDDRSERSDLDDIRDGVAKCVMRITPDRMCCRKRCEMKKQRAASVWSAS